MTINFKAHVYETDIDAIYHAKTSDNGVAIRFRGRHLVVDRETANRLEAAGSTFAYLCDDETPDHPLRILTIPVN
jgi:hypothetical protein